VNVLTELRQLRGDVDELLAAHEETRDMADFARYRDRPLAFMRDELGFEPYEKQMEVIEAFQQRRRVVVRGNHGAGKDAVLAPLMLYAAYVCRMLVIAISATERQLLGQLWREVTARFSSRLPGQLYSADLRIHGEKRIIAMTSGSTSNLTGWHDPNGVLIVVSEAQGQQVEEAAFDAAIANAVDDASRIVVAGNPINTTGRFYEVSRKATWHAIRISAFDHPNVREQRVVIAGGPAPGWPAEMEKEFGVDSAWYVSRVLGEFPTQGSIDSLVKLQWLEDAYERYEGSSLAGYRDKPFPVLALDVARSLEGDESVAAVAQSARVHGVFAWRSRNLVDTAGRFLMIADRTRAAWYGAITGDLLDAESLIARDARRLTGWLDERNVPHFRLYVDAPGVGSGVIDECRRRRRHVTEYWGWVPAIDDNRWANLRAETYWNFRTLLQDGKAALPRDPLLHEEALAIEWSQDKKGRIVILPKEELRRTLKRSPDRLDSAVMALWGATAARNREWSAVNVKWA
jgi:hypothetical protein